MVSIHTLGQALIDAGDSRVTPTSFRKFALLLHLSAENGRSVARSVLQELIFPDQTDKNARHSLRELSYQLRQAGVAIQSDSTGIALAADSVRADYAELISHHRLSAAEVEAAAGGFLPGYAPAHSEAFAEWFEGYRARATFDLSKALLREVAGARASADWIAGERAARACLVIDPLNEEGHLALAEVLAIGGSKHQAVKLLERYMDEVGESSRDLRLPAAILKRRITGHIPPAYSSPYSSPFVGRTVEAIQLAEQLTQAESEAAQCVVLTGEPGIGKSRLVAEFCKIAAIRGAVVGGTAAHPGDLHRPFGCFGDLMPSLLSMPGSLGCAPDALRLLDRLTKNVSDEQSGSLHALGDSEALSYSIAQAIVDLIDSISGEQPIVLAIEDAHWLDRASFRVLVFLASRRKPCRVLIVLTTRQREGVEIVFQEALSLTSIEVSPLDADAASRMIRALSETGGVEVDHEMHAWLIDTAGGNPLFLETLFAHYASTRQRFAVSPTLSALLARRLESLSADAGTTLRICALLGKYSTLEAITEALQVPRLTLLRAVSELEAARLVKAQGRSIEPSHRLIAEVAQRDWAPATKHVAHHCVASALESLLVGEQSTALMWDCAEHWIAARNSDKALNAIRRCSNRALEIGRPAEAAEILGRALDLEIGATDQIAICRQMVLAADEASESALVFRGLDVLRKHDRGQHHDELEFAEFRARSRLWNDAPAEQERLLQCAAAEDATPNHRVMAAIWLLKHSDTQLTAALGKAAIDALGTDVVDAADEAVRLEFELIAQCAYLDWERAVITARKVLIAATTTSPQISLNLRFNASLAFERCGHLSEAIEAATSVYFDAEARGSRHLQIRTAAFLGDQAFDFGDDSTATLWFDRVAAILDRTPRALADFGPMTALLNHLLTIENGSEARALFDRVERAGLFAESRLRERWHEVLTERLRQVEKRRAPAAAYEGPAVAHLQKETHMLGITDFEVATSCHGRLEKGMLNEARSVMSDYLGWRSYSKQPRSRCLNVALAELNAAVALGNATSDRFHKIDLV